MRHFTMRSASSALLLALIALITVVQATASTHDPGLERALAAQRALVEDHAPSAVAYNDLGNLLLLADRVSEAESAYMRAIELDSTQATARFNLAVLLMQRGESQQAVEHLEAVLAVDPEHAWANYQLGILLEARGDRSRAIKSYAQAFASDHSLTFAENNPHIIDNKLTTQALLRAQAYIESGTSVQVPRQYGEGRRIKALMLGMDEDRLADPDSEVGSDEEMSVQETSSRAGGTADDEDYARGTSDDESGREEAFRVADDASDTRVLSSEDLDASDRTGEATGGAAAPPRGPGSVFNRYRPPRSGSTATGGTGTQRNPTTTPSTRTRNQAPVAGVAVPTAPSQNNRPSTEADRQGNAERLRSQRFRPSARSSAQLELSLEAVTESAG